MPERIHPEPGHEIQVAIALDVVDKDSLAPAQHERIAVISLQQILPFKFRDLFKRSHSEDSILPEGMCGNRTAVWILRKANRTRQAAEMAERRK